MHLNPTIPETATPDNHQDDVAILVPSFDGYQDLWKPFFCCFFKYWPDCPYPVYLGSNFQTYEDPRVKPVKIGPDRDYSSNLIAMLSEIPHGWVIIMLEDILLSSPVNTNRVKRAVAEGEANHAGLLQLLPRRFEPNAGFAAHPISEELNELPLGLPYRASLNLGLWKKIVLLKLLNPGESAWEFEYQGTKRTFALKDRFFCMSRKYISDPLFMYVHGIIKRKWAFPAPKFLQREGLWESSGKNRPVQSLFSHLYSAGYAVLRYFVFWIVHKLWGIQGIRTLVSIKAKS